MFSGSFDFPCEHPCRNLSLGLATKARACKGEGQEGNLGVTSHAPGSVGECENEHSHSQVNSHFGSWSPDGLSNLKKAISRVNTHWIGEFLISFEKSWNVDVQSGLA
jgi:hypothetical protein